MNLASDFVAWLVRNWNSDATMTVAEIADLHVQWLGERGDEPDATPGKNLAVILTMCGHCGDPIVDGQHCGANELERSDDGDTTTIQWGPHEVTEDSTKELVCGACGCHTFRYEENVISYRKMVEFDEDSMMLRIDGHSEEGDGDDDPGLLCDDWNGGCGKPVTLPDGVEIDWV